LIKELFIVKKKCNKCNKTRLIRFFWKRKASKDGYSSFCVDCAKQKNKNHYHSCGGKEYFKKLYQTNKSTILKRNKKWNKENTEKIKYHKKKFLDKNPKYYTEYNNKNRKILNEKCKSRHKKYIKNPIFKLKINYRSRLYSYYRGTSRSKRSEEIVGLPWIEFKKYIEKKFKLGMTWENYGEWHIDHIIPLSSAKTKKELERLFYYTNCQPLWALDNLRKGYSLVRA
jgi:hypothetical protein